MTRPETEPQFNPYTDEVELLADPVRPPIDDDPDILDASANNEDLEDLEDLEFTLSAHEYNAEPTYTEPFKEEPSSAGSSQNNEFMVADPYEKKKALRRRAILIGTAFVLVIVIIAISVAASLSK